MSDSGKFVVWDEGWAPYACEFASRLGPEWRVTAAGSGTDCLREEIREATALLAVRVPAEVLPDARALRLFLFPGAGMLTPDPSAFPMGCRVVNVYEHESPVAEYVLMVMLAHTTRFLTCLDAFRAGRWDGSGRVGGEPHGELAGRTLALFGYGHIGQAIASRARAFGMRVAAVSRGPIPEEVPQPDFLGGQSNCRNCCDKRIFWWWPRR